MGVMHCFVKYVLFLLNLLFTILGAGLIILGALLLVHFKNIAESSDEAINNIDLETTATLELLSIFIIVLGCVLFLIAFSGCCGAVTESKCLLVTYAIFMLLLVAAKIYVTIVFSSEVQSMQQKLDNFIIEAVDDPVHNITLHGMEVMFKCCGTTGPEIYEIIPPTCCGINNITEINIDSQCNIEDAYSIGCLDFFNDYIAKIENIIRIVLICFIVFETLEFIAAIYLCSSIKKRPKPQNYSYY